MLPHALFRRTASTVFALVTLSTAVPATVWASSDQTIALGAAGPVRAGAWLPLMDIYQHLVAQGYREVLGIERHALGYEAIVPGPDQERVRLFVDPRSGQVVGSEVSR